MSSRLEARAPNGAGSRILGIGSYQPENVVTTEDLADRLGLEAGWIRDRVGIDTRHFAALGETLMDLAVRAGTSALEDAGVLPGEVDVVIVATSSLLRPIPNAAARVAQRIGASSSGAFDVNAACAGFCYSLAVGSDLVRAGSARYALVIGTETISDFLDLDDRKTAFIFGDGAGAAVVGPSIDIGIGPPVWAQQGGLSEALYQRENGSLDLDGPAVFRWATVQLPRLALRALDRAGVLAREVDAVVMHQANLRIVRVVERLLREQGLRDDVVIADDIKVSGNTSAASVPLALDRLRQEGRVRSGDIVITTAVGAGMTGAAQVVVCP